jgi:4-diphosphocytidyl-2-C-methyl-D-erythritol kinase
MRGVGDQLGPPITLPGAFAVLVNPNVATPTRQVFDELGLAAGSYSKSSHRRFSGPKTGARIEFDSLVGSRNDLEPAAIRVAPVIESVLQRLSCLPNVKLTRMSGSGATCFALFESRRSAAIARKIIATDRPSWWVNATSLH